LLKNYLKKSSSNYFTDIFGNFSKKITLSSELKEYYYFSMLSTNFEHVDNEHIFKKAIKLFLPRLQHRSHTLSADDQISS
jgi:hypothetical protein